MEAGVHGFPFRNGRRWRLRCRAGHPPEGTGKNAMNA
jgi:hypothetical protein